MNFFKFLILTVSLFSLNSQASDVLQIGDSQSFGVFGKTLHEKFLVDSRLSFTIGARGGATVTSWVDYQLLKGNFRVFQADGKIITVTPELMPSLTDFITKHNPKTIIIQLGGNMVRQTDTEVREAVAQMIKIVKKQTQKCIWIGPPNGHKRPQPRFGEFYPVLKQAVEKDGCKFVDSRLYTTYPDGLGDGIHYDTLGKQGKKLVNVWVKKLYKEIKKDL